VELAGHGVSSLLVNQPEGPFFPEDPNPPVTETIFEMRELSRDLDLLASRPQIDPARLGLVGFSFGAVRGATFAGAQGGRLKIAVLASLASSYDSPAMASFDPIVWVPHISPTALFLQEGRQEGWSTAEEIEAMANAAREPKRLVWYETGHGLDEQSYLDRLGWLAQALGPG
jgi:predicted esterase